MRFLCALILAVFCMAGVHAQRLHTTLCTQGMDSQGRSAVLGMALDKGLPEHADSLSAAALADTAVLADPARKGWANYVLAAGLWSRLAHTRKAKATLQVVKERSEELLLNILPEEVAEELKAKGAADAVHIDQVTVLFTDFQGFTAMSEALSPNELVWDLHECFSAFDAITEQHGLEKIKTIGDAYMAAGGLPVENTTHAVDAVRAALEMRDFIAKGKAHKQAEGKPFFEIRIGIHTGPVVAGIVGVKKFHYDIWGDTVNTASRMESSGEVGQVNITEATYALVKDAIAEDSVASTHRVDRNNDGDGTTVRPLPAFTFTPRGKVQAKGKGEMETYIVNTV